MATSRTVFPHRFTHLPAIKTLWHSFNQFLESSVSQKITACHAKASAIKLNDLNAPIDTFIKSLTNKEKQQYRDFSASETGRKHTDFSTNFEQKNAFVLPIIEEKYNIYTQVIQNEARL